MKGFIEIKGILHAGNAVAPEGVILVNSAHIMFVRIHKSIVVLYINDNPMMTNGQPSKYTIECSESYEDIKALILAAQ